jgi:hypothetical protein
VKPKIVSWRTGAEVRLDNISVLNQTPHHEDMYGGLDPRFLDVTALTH